MNKTIFVVMFLISFGVAYQSIVIAGNTRMTTEELTALISGTTVFGTSSRGKKYIQIYGADGSLESGLVKKGQKWKPREYGTWKVKDGKLCNTYKKPKPRDGGCDKFYKTDDGEYIYTTGSGRQGSFDKIIEGRHPE